MDNRKNSLIYWIIFILVVVAVGSYFYFTLYADDGVWGGGDVLSISIKDNVSEDSKMIETSNDYYNFEIPNEWTAYLDENSNITVIEEKEQLLNEMYSGPSIVIGSTDISSVLDYFNAEVNNIKDEGIIITEEENLLIEGKLVNWIKVDYSTSYWPSNGEVVYIYHFDTDDNMPSKYSVIIYSALEEQTLQENKMHVISIIEDLIN